MSLNPEISQISYRQSVTRKAPMLMRVLLLLMYVCVGIFTFLGTMWGFPMLVLSLGTLAFAWYYKGEISVSYEYQIDGTRLTIRRLSGPRQKPRNVVFAEIDLARVIVIGDQGTGAIEEAQSAFDAAAKSRRVTYYTSAHDPDRPGIVLFARGTGAEEGMLVRAYLQPTGPLLDTLRRICPRKVPAHGD